MASDKLIKLDNFCSMNFDLPDGAFFAKAEEEGIALEDWEWYSEQQKKGE